MIRIFDHCPHRNPYYLTIIGQSQNLVTFSHNWSVIIRQILVLFFQSNQLSSSYTGVCVRVSVSVDVSIYACEWVWCWRFLRVVQVQINVSYKKHWCWRWCWALDSSSKDTVYITKMHSSRMHTAHSSSHWGAWRPPGCGPGDPLGVSLETPSG